MKKWNLFLISFIINFILSFIPLFANSKDHVIKSIEIKGNSYLSTRSILPSFSHQIGDLYVNEKINKSVKDLFSTGYFSNIRTVFSRGILTVSVEETPFLNIISFNNNYSITTSKLLDIITIKQYEPLNYSKLVASCQNIIDIYNRSGFLFAELTTKLKSLKKNLVNLEFDIKENDVCYLKNIYFLGNENVSCKLLKKKILSKEYAWYRFFSSCDFYDLKRFEFDKEVIRDYYLNNGFFDFNLISTIVEVSNDKYCSLIFNINEGSVYKFGKCSIINKINEIKLNLREYEDLCLCLEKKVFSVNLMEKVIMDFIQRIYNKENLLVDINPIIEKDEKSNLIDIKFEIRPDLALQVERIEIFGNNRTYDEIIRREIELYEGDFFNRLSLHKSIQKIRSLGYFKDVNFVTKSGTASEKIIIEIYVQEQATGEFQVAGGYGTIDGVLGKLNLSERNFFGKGQEISAMLSLSRKYQEFNLEFMDPYFLNIPISMGVDVFTVKSNRLDCYTHHSKGLNWNFSYYIANDFRHILSYSLNQDAVSEIRTNSRFLSEQSGKSFSSTLNYSLIYDKRDNKISSSDGYFINLGNTFSGIGGNIFYIKNTLSSSHYYTPIKDDLSFITKISLGILTNINQEPIRIVDSFQLGADSLRGFEYGGVGPKDSLTNDALGGRRYWNISQDIIFSSLFPNDYGVKFTFFTHWGNIWNAGLEEVPGGRLGWNSISLEPSIESIGYKSLNSFLDKNEGIRGSIGLGIIWNSPFGPLRLDYAHPVVHSNKDILQKVLFGFSTQF